MGIIKFKSLESKLIEYKNELVLVDRDAAQIYGITTKEINQAVSKRYAEFHGLACGVSTYKL